MAGVLLNMGLFWWTKQAKYSSHTILLSDKIGRSFAICNNMDETGKYNTKWNKSESENQRNYL